MRKRPILITMTIVVGAQLGLWIIGGRDRPLTAVSRIIVQKVEEERRLHEEETGKPLFGVFEETYVLCPELGKATSDRDLRVLKDSLSPLLIQAINESDGPKGWETNSVPGTVFTGLCAEVVWQTPVVAQVDIIYRNQLWYGTVGVGHRVWPILGFMVPGSENYSWQF